MKQNLQVGCMPETPIFIAGEINQDLFNGDPEKGFMILSYVIENMDYILNGLSEAFQDYMTKQRLDLKTSHDVAYGYIKKLVDEIDFDNSTIYNGPELETLVQPVDPWETIKNDENLSETSMHIVQAIESADLDSLEKLELIFPELVAAYKISRDYFN